MASGKTITLFPNAFTNAESLISTLAHERTHIFQYKLFGQTYAQNNPALFEEAAYHIEGTFIKYWVRNEGK